ncbi:ABC transporter ATP-binding protein [Halorubrum sp. CBA1125]|uniref:ABC transporter ATP-binding protein n=1 Tax=Halorubrum sp. CBA1125 TaxID=2668072 RepID=UPI002AA2B306|nr:ABC transporter ATP-binding protein [Halorubrum sp. CBA1125]
MVVDALTRTYGGVPVLDSVSLVFGPGLTAVIGPNGSGKSTLLGALAGTVPPTTGQVQRPNAEDRGRKSIGYLPQRVPFREGFTARETLAFYARLVEGDPDAALASVGLSDAADKPIEDLSGGMQRLLGIAQAMLGDPPLVVLDEPASGLDPGMRERAFRTAATHATDDVTVVVSTHNLDLVDAHADRVVMLARGQVVAAGDLDALRDEYSVDTTAALYEAARRDATLSETADDGDPARSGAAAEDERSGSGDDSDRDVHVTGVSER